MIAKGIIRYLFPTASLGLILCIDLLYFLHVTREPLERKMMLKRGREDRRSVGGGVRKREEEGIRKMRLERGRRRGSGR